MMASLSLLIRGYGDFPFQALLVPHETTFPVSHLSGYRGLTTPEIDDF